MMRLSTRLAAIAFVCSFSVAAQAAGLDLSTYHVDFAKSVNVAEASAITYNWDRNSLLIVGDETGVNEFDLNGNVYAGVYDYLGLSSFQDTEAVTYIGNGQYVVGDERPMNMWLVSVEGTVDMGGGLTRYQLSNKHSGQSFALSPFNVGNIGLEGVSYDSITGNYFAVKENSPQAVYYVDVDMNNTAAGGTYTELFNPALLGFQTISDIKTLSTVTAFAGSGFEENLLLLSATSQKLLEVTRSGEIVSSFDLSGLFGPTGQKVQTIEGVTFDNDGNIYLAAELGSPGSTLVKLSRDAAVPEPASWAMMIAGFGFVGAAMRRRRVAFLIA